jgi:hypothetical protein
VELASAKQHDDASDQRQQQQRGHDAQDRRGEDGKGRIFDNDGHADRCKPPLPLTLTLLVALSPSFPPHSTPCSGHLSETPRNAQAVKKEKSPVKLSALKRTKVPVFRGKDSKKGSGEGEVLNI